MSDILWDSLNITSTGPDFITNADIARTVQANVDNVWDILDLNNGTIRLFRSDDHYVDVDLVFDGDDDEYKIAGWTFNACDDEGRILDTVEGDIHTAKDIDELFDAIAEWAGETTREGDDNE